jgi:hypothetical protein
MSAVGIAKGDIAISFFPSGLQYHTLVVMFSYLRLGRGAVYGRENGIMAIAFRHC